MEVRLFMTDASEGFFPAAGSSKEPWEGHRRMLDPSWSQIFAPGVCTGRAGDALHRISHFMGRSGHARLSRVFFIFSPLPLFLNKINKYNLTLIVTVLINV